MPRISFIDQQQGLGGPPDLALAGRNTALNDEEAYLDKQAQADGAIEGLKVLSNFNVAQQQRQEQLRSTVKTPDGFTPLALEDWDKQWADLTSNIGNSYVTQFLDERVGAARTAYAGDALRWETGARQEQRVTNMTEGLNGLGAIVLRNPQSYGNALQEWDSTLAASGLDIAQQGKLRLAGRQQLAVSYGDALIHSDPTKALQEFASDPSFTSLDPDKLYALQSRADAKIQHMVAMADHQQIVSERNRKLAGDQLAKEGEDLLAKGQMSEAWLQQNRLTLDPSDYRILRHGMQEGGGVDSAPALASILTGIYRDNVDQAPAITSALQSRQITAQTAKSLYDDNKSIAPGPVVQARAFVTKYMVPSDLTASVKESQGLAEAMAEFNRRIAQDPKQDPMTLARDVVKRNSIINTQDMLVVMPLPQYFTGARGDATGVDHKAALQRINDADVATTKAFMAKHNNDLAAVQADADYKREQLLVQKWRAQLSQQISADAATAQGGVK